MGDFTDCSVCHRVVYPADVDDQGRCCFCEDKEPRPPGRPAPVGAEAETGATTAPAAAGATTGGSSGRSHRDWGGRREEPGSDVSQDGTRVDEG